MLFVDSAAQQQGAVARRCTLCDIAELPVRPQNIRGARPLRCEPCKAIVKTCHNAILFKEGARRKNESEANGTQYVKFTPAEKHAVHQAVLDLPKEYCAICFRTREETKFNIELSLDHIHGTLTPRGYLCSDCNWMLRDDVLGDGIKYFTNVLAYLSGNSPQRESPLRTSFTGKQLTKMSKKSPEKKKLAAAEEDDVGNRRPDGNANEDNDTSQSVTLFA